MALYSLEEIKVVHLEITSRCNARCPMCARNQNGGRDNPLLLLSELKLQDVQKLLSPDFLQQLGKAYLCGNYGDPIVASECLQIVQYMRRSNASLLLSINTNGGARDEAFWKALARELSYSRFGIDGLKDTNHIYRQGVSWERLERNVRSFIDAGGTADWDFLVFKHNEHQVDEARALAKQWGFRSFNPKSTARFFSTHRQSFQPTSPVKNLEGETVGALEMAQDLRFQNAFYDQQKDLISTYGSLANYWDQTSIDCRAIQEKSIYISAQGWLFPCCWVGGEMYSPLLHHATNQLTPLLGENRETDVFPLDALHHGLEAVLKSPLFERTLQESWSLPRVQEGKPKVCARNCGQRVRPFDQQFLTPQNF